MNELNLFMFVTNVVVVLICGFLTAILPIITRKSLLFGVRIPESASHSNSAIQLRKRYIFIMSAITLIISAIVILQSFILPKLNTVLCIYYPFLVMIPQLILYVNSWRKAKELKQEKEWKIPVVSLAETRSSVSRGNLSQMPWAYFIISFIIIIGSIILGAVMYPSLPDKIPTHFDFNMQPDAWSDKSIIKLITIPVVLLIMLVIFVITTAWIIVAKLQINTENPSLSFAQHRQYRRYMAHAMGICTIGITVMMLLVLLPTIIIDFVLPTWILYMTMSVAILPVIIVSIRVGQSGCKLKPKITDADSTAAGYQFAGSIDRSDDDFWKLGMFYYNKDDPSVIVEDRFGINLGFNYARFPVIIGIVIFIIGIIVLYAFCTNLFLSL